MTDFIRSPVFQLKVLECVLSLVAVLSMIGWIYPSLNSVFLTELVHFSLFGWIMMDALIIGGYLLREPVSKFLILLVSLSGALFNLISAIILIVSYANWASTRHMVAFIVTLVNAVACGGDSFYLIRFHADSA